MEKRCDEEKDVRGSKGSGRRDKRSEGVKHVFGR